MLGPPPTLTKTISGAQRLRTIANQDVQLDATMDNCPGGTVQEETNRIVQCRCHCSLKDEEDRGEDEEEELQLLLLPKGSPALCSFIMFITTIMDSHNG